jgi:hypothetical protein
MPLPDSVSRRIAAIDALVGQGAWSDAEALVGGLPELIDALPELERKPALLALSSFLDELETRIRSTSDEVAGELGAVRTGRRAADRYRACAGASERE